MSAFLAGKRILLGVTGSIAAYKAADLASKLSQAGAQVDVLLTAAALQFVTPLTFQSVTGRRVYTDADLWGREGHVQHIGLGQNADLLVVAPASANTIAKLAHGLADNLLTVTALAARCPLMIAPAMDGGMYAHPATQANLANLRARGAKIAGPASGHLASGLSGVGRLLEPLDLVGHIRRFSGLHGPLRGRLVVATAGGTQEPIDPVRVIANRSSGKQGFALAQAALDLGARVILISGPTNLPTPVGVERVDVQTAAEMAEATLQALPGADMLLMAAAVADFRPVNPAAQKIKKQSGPPEIHLERTPDILAQVAEYRADHHWPRLSVGFAAETQDLLENASKKLEAKRLDLIVANDVSAPDAGFAVETNRVTLLSAGGLTESLPLMSKDQVAAAVLEHALRLLPTSEPDWIIHLCPAADWQAAQAKGVYRGDTIDTQGFIHFSGPGQVLRVANTYYRGRRDLLLLWVDSNRLTAELRWEYSDDLLFPHLYGPLNLEAVLASQPIIPDNDGIFRSLPGPAA
ncbi:MAG TPA: bifunctional phosphopantothenoylcysteine decarboxylase/phosphopantothenate--cysteine ligase CoaBC [Anaerolineales bacterium]|nr:bifunctional phosphopantothenoylcysteine decarboxylase/phosphopantothenate--cysteine ligase CoaBC [Anaerolineales bacterium]